MKRLLFAILLISGAANAQSGVRGVITYYFNQYQGDKPDIGSTVTLVNVADLPGFHISTYDTFYQANIYRNLSSVYAKKNIPESIKAQLARYRGDDDSYFTDVDHRNASQCVNLNISPKAKKATVDALGTFAMAAEPGTYIICIRSNARKGMTMSEIMGKVYCKSITVQSGEMEEVSHKFDQY